MKEIIKIDEFKKYNNIQKANALKRIALGQATLEKKELEYGKDSKRNKKRIF